MTERVRRVDKNEYTFLTLRLFILPRDCLYSGPAGTGKTESVKALGNQLGRFVLVFNCDETFDFQVSYLKLYATTCI